VKNPRNRQFDDVWQIYAGDTELQTQVHSSRRDILEPGVEDNDEPSRQACTAASEEQSASAGHHALAVTDHARTSEPQ